MYDLPLSGTGLPDLTVTQTSTWGQSLDLPRTGAAIFPASHLPPAGTGGGYAPASADWPYAELHYLDVDGREVNTASYGAGAWQIDTTRYDTTGNEVWQLAPRNRAQALNPAGDTDPYAGARASSAERADLLATVSTYASDGIDLKQIEGPVHPVTLASGAVVSARQRTRYDYDQGAPTADSYHLLTTTVTDVEVLDGTATPGAADSRTTTTGYNPIDGAAATGDTSGWTVRQATTQTTVMPGGTDIVARTRYDSSGRVVEARMPGDATGATAGTELTTYYTTASNATYPSCGGRPEWAGLVCRVQHAANPSAGPALPDKKITSYNVSDKATTVTETSGAYTRTTTNDYDTAGRADMTKVTVTPALTGNTNVPTLKMRYDASTGLATSIDSLDASYNVTASVTTGYDSLGRVTSYTDASGAVTTTGYDGDDHVTSVSDGKTTTTYSYDGNDAAGNAEHRGLATSMNVGFGSGTPSTFTGAYNADGALTRQTYPSGLQTAASLDNTGTPVGLTYTEPIAGWSLRYTNDTNGFGQVIGASSPLSSQRYDYDATGRLTKVLDHPTGDSCTRRDYAFEGTTGLNSNRTGLAAASFSAGADGACTGAAGTSETLTYDTADRLTTGGYSYDAFGRTTAVPAADAGGTTMAVGYYSTDMVASQTQGTRTRSWSLDPAGRLLTATDSISGGSTNHYSNSSDSPAWISTTDTTGTSTGWSHNIESLTGQLAGTQVYDAVTGSTTSTLQLTDLRGNITATVDNVPGVTAPRGQFDYTEYGTPRDPEISPTGYGWLGGSRRSSDTLGELTLMGVRLYNSSTGRFLQTDPVPGGSANAYDYVSQDPVNHTDIPGTRRDDGCSVADYLYGVCRVRVVNGYRVHRQKLEDGTYVMGVHNDHCSGLRYLGTPDHPGGFHFKPVCDMHDFGYELIRAGVLPASAKTQIDNLFHSVLDRHVCNTHKYRGVECRQIAARYSYIVHNYGGHPKRRRDGYAVF